ncbi:MAG: L,D-transpeptidase family protein [Thiolinea sp.]
MKKLTLLTLILLVTAAVLYHYFPRKTQTVMDYAKQTVRHEKHTVSSRLEQFGESARSRLAPHFVAAGIHLPPEAVRLLAFKDTEQLELYARNADTEWRKVHTYPIQAASGHAGPKLREGDKQVPEGFYDIEAFNPNSRFHVSLRLNYPNPFDLAMAKAEQRTEPGSDIMIHGKAVSVGCLAMGDTVAEELFALTAWVGREKVKVIIAPTDFRKTPDYRFEVEQPGWLPELYKDIRAELANYPLS